MILKGKFFILLLLYFEYITGYRDPMAVPNYTEDSPSGGWGSLPAACFSIPDQSNIFR